ncbi:hypothetical protein [Kineococcus sp. NBC_00420]|uniref:hypothetical protein n=1 Tax=Kineococcus sp. NBC_00420 TaxID=2903564 RepID=UPI003FA522DC
MFAKRRSKSGKRPGPPVHDDLVRQKLTATRPNNLWLNDITEHWTAEDKFYLCAIKDVFSRRIGGGGAVVLYCTSEAGVVVPFDVLVQSVPGVRLEHLLKQGVVNVGVVVRAAGVEPYPQDAAICVVANSVHVVRNDRVHLHDVLLVLLAIIVQYHLPVEFEGPMEGAGLPPGARMADH